MAIQYITQQLAPLIANAGVTQTITISTPTSLNLTPGQTVPPGTPGVATASGGSGTASGITWPQFAVYAFIAALAYFSLKWWGKG